MIISHVQARAFISLVRVMPSIPGRFTSIRASSKGSRSTLPRNSSADLVTVAAKPRLSSARPRKPDMELSSSIMRIAVLFSFIRPFVQHSADLSQQLREFYRFVKLQGIVYAVLLHYVGVGVACHVKKPEAGA